MEKPPVIPERGIILLESMIASTHANLCSCEELELATNAKIAGQELAALKDILTLVHIHNQHGGGER